VNLMESHIVSKINELSNMMKRIHELEIEIAKLKNELNDVRIEKKNHSFRYSSDISVNEKYNSKEYLKLIHRLERPKNIFFIEKWIINFRFKIKIQKIQPTDLLVKL